MTLLDVAEKLIKEELFLSAVSSKIEQWTNETHLFLIAQSLVFGNVIRVVYYIL